MNEITTTNNSMSGHAMTIVDVGRQVQLIQQVMASVMKEGEHYGTVPGCGSKKVLMKSGAEKLAVTFRLAPEYTINKTEMVGGHREYEVVCKMVHIPTGDVVGHGVGSCSTMESKYRWRNANKSCPECGAEAIIKGKKEYGGGWVCFAAKGGCGKKFKDGDESIEKQGGKVENTDIADVYNTVLKMAKKRAQIDATLTCTGASDIFGQDLDEYSEDEIERLRQERGGADNGEGGGKKPRTAQPKKKSSPEKPGPRVPSNDNQSADGLPSLEDFKREAEVFKDDKSALESFWNDRKDVALDILGEKRWAMLHAFVKALLGSTNDAA